MNDSLMPDKSRGGNKTAIFLLIGGGVLMAAAGVVLLVRSFDASSAAPPPEIKNEKVSARPLVAEALSQSALSDTDTSSLETDTSSLEAPSAREAASEDVETISKTASKKKNKKKQRVDGPMGVIDPKAVNAYIKAHFSQVKGCYERRLKVKPFLQGKVDLNIAISASGKVTGVKVNSDTVRDAAMLSCVKSTVRGWRFPKPEGGRVVIAKTFNFKKRN